MSRLARVAAVLLLLAARAGASEELNLFAWSEYVPQKVLNGFRAETGIEVNYETYASNEELLSKLLAGGASYDLIQPSDYTAEVLIRQHLLAPLDLSRLPNLPNIAAEYRHLPHDPEGRFTVPYMTGTVGIVVNTAAVKEPVRGYGDVFQEKYRDRIVALNDNRELVTWALYTLGIPANAVSHQNLALARPVLSRWIGLVKVFDSDSPKTALLNGDVDLGVVWSGEAAILWRQDPKFRFVLPAEGVAQFVDVLAIPLSAAHKEAAHRFINYILRPEVSRLISDEFPYTNPNLAARRLLTAEQLANPASYPKGDRKLETFRDIGKLSAELDSLVTDLKSAR
jgi:spermidine/putrescine transport system substrate-binding protein